MTPDEARASAYAAFLDEWGSTTLVQLEGRDFSVPPPGTRWVRVSFRNYGGGQHTLGPPAGSAEAPAGGRIFRRVGAVLVQVFTPSSEGLGIGATLAHAARAIFEGRRVGGVDFYDGQIRESPLGRGERSYQTNVEVRCSYDETK